MPTAREGYVFRNVCQSFCLQRGVGIYRGSAYGGGVCIQGVVCLQRGLTMGVCIQGMGGLHPGGGLHLGGLPPILVATAAVGGHPTGMHSCSLHMSFT